DLAGHAAARAAVRLAGRVDARQPRPELLVGRELVEQAALEAAAVAEQAVVGQRHVLGLGHLHRDGIEAPQVRRAAELAAARPDAVHDLRRVTRADLAHLDPRPELARQIAHEVAEVDPLLGVEVHGRPARHRVHLDVDHLHHEAAAARDPLAGDDRALFALAALAVRARLLVARQAQDTRVRAILLHLGDLAPGPADFADHALGRRLDEHQVADVELEVADTIIVGLSGGPKP